MNWCIIIPILTGLISALLGYLIGKSLSGDDNAAEINVWKSKYASLERDLDDCRAKLTAHSQPFIPFDAALAKSVFGRAIKENDLKVVEGIGPKIEKLFKSHGINTWKELSESTVASCQKVLDDGGEAYQIHDPETWPEQARLAYEGKWETLLKWQEDLTGGRI